MNPSLILKSGMPGDILLSGSNSFISRLIRYAQKVQTKDGKPSRWSHASIVYKDLTVFESTIDFEPYDPEHIGKGKRLVNGVQLNKLSIFKDDDPMMLMSFPFSEVQRGILLDKIDRVLLCGYTYPILGLIGSLLSYWIFRGWKSNPLQSKHSLYCSAAVQEVYSSLGIDFDVNHTSRNTSPEIISQFACEGLVKYL